MPCELHNLHSIFGKPKTAPKKKSINFLKTQTYKTNSSKNRNKPKNPHKFYIGI